MFNIMSQELNINGKICQNLDKCLEYTNKHRKMLADDFDSQFAYYRDINREVRTSYIK